MHSFTLNLYNAMFPNLHGTSLSDPRTDKLIWHVEPGFPWSGGLRSWLWQQKSNSHIVDDLTTDIRLGLGLGTWSSEEFHLPVNIT